MSTIDQNGFRFRNWPVYEDARNFRLNMKKLIILFPKTELYSLIDQISRALNSILLNLAEGSNKNTDKDTRVYVNRAQGSLDEVVACLDCALDDGFITNEQHTEACALAGALAKQLKGFTFYLSKVND